MPRLHETQIAALFAAARVAQRADLVASLKAALPRDAGEASDIGADTLAPFAGIIDAYADKIADPAWQHGQVETYLARFCRSVEAETGRPPTPEHLAAQRAAREAEFDANAAFARIAALQVQAIAT